MRRRSFLALSGACGLCGCSGAVHQLPQVGESHLRLAQTELKGAGVPLQRRNLTEGEVVAALQSAGKRIIGPAQRLCDAMNVGVCDWQFRYSLDRSLNAGAGPRGLVVINRGVVEHAANEEQVCMVIAHEIGHQAANHIANGERNQTIGAVLLGAAVAIASGNSAEGAGVRRSAIELGANVGARIGRLSFSKEQEREADYLAALILHRAGVDLDKARGLQVAMAWDSRHDRTGWFDTHPTGPDRLAAWDRAVAEIRASNGRLPQRAG